MSQTLREQFEQEETLHWENDQGEPEIEYVVWLEAKVEKFNSALRQPTKQGSEPAEICLCGSQAAWLAYRKCNALTGMRYCPNCGKLLPC
jgi:hypothetical protein